VIILDTNVLSEPLRPEPDPRVVEWLDSQHNAALYLTALTVAEVRTGIGILPEGQRKELLHVGFEDRVLPRFYGRILPFEETAATEFAELQVEARSSGRALSPFDGLIAAIARSTRFALATRNTRDFAGYGITLIDPWG
jgi:predicted nucleic acid-binding protein